MEYLKNDVAEELKFSYPLETGTKTKATSSSSFLGRLKVFRVTVGAKGWRNPVDGRDELRALITAAESGIYFIHAQLHRGKRLHRYPGIELLEPRGKAPINQSTQLLMRYGIINV